MACAEHRVALPADAAGVDLVVAAAEALRREGAVGRAATYLAWCLAASGLSETRRAQVALAHADALLLAGRFDEAEAALDGFRAPEFAPALEALCALF